MADIIEDSEQSQNSPQGRETVDLDDITSSGNDGDYIDTGIGQEVRMVVDRIEKVQDDEYTLSSMDHRFELVDREGDRMSVTVWSLWGKIQEAYRQARESGLNGVSGLHLYVNHPAREEYVVGWRLNEEDEWTEVGEPEN